MKVTIFCPDQELAPLLDRHLADPNQSAAGFVGAAVASMIVEAIKLYNDVEKAMASNDKAALALIDRSSNRNYGAAVLQIIRAEREKE